MISTCTLSIQNAVVSLDPCGTSYSAQIHRHVHGKDCHDNASSSSYDIQAIHNMITVKVQNGTSFVNDSINAIIVVLSHILFHMVHNNIDLLFNVDLGQIFRVRPKNISVVVIVHHTR
jgi:hypothetical protein